MSDELLDAFLTEGRDLVARAMDDLAELQESPGDTRLLEGLFRSVHTLKGSVALFDWPDFLRMLHTAEDVLGAWRDGRRPEPDIVDALHACLARTEAWIDVIATRGAPPDSNRAEADAIIARLQQAPADAADTPSATDGPDRALLAELVGRASRPPAGPLVVATYIPDADCFFRGDDPAALAAATPGLLAMKITPREPWGELETYAPFACNLRFDILSDAPLAEVQTALRLVFDQVSLTQAGPASSNAAPNAASAVSPQKALRVDPQRIDALAHALDELIVAKNALSQLAAQAEAGGAGDALARAIRAQQADIGALTARMHASLSTIRLVSITPTLRRLPRIIRDLASRLEKAVDVELSCDEIEADKAVADALTEPLLHVLRNALDHGVEPAAARLAAGKPARATIRVTARRMGDQLSISIADDGGGIDPDRMRETARRAGALPPAAIEALDDRAAIDLVFAPGFSTAARVSDISGRGVGLDAVRTAVERLGGRVEIASAKGVGTTFSFRLPLAIVLSRIAVVEAGGGVYGVPLDAVVELARVPRAAVSPVRAGRAFTLREHAVPLISLESLVDAPPRAEPEDLRVLIVRSGADLVGVAIDRIVDRMEAVVQPLRGLLAGLRGFSGTTLRGDGSVLLVLDVEELIG